MKNKFEEFNLSKDIIKAVSDLGYEKPSEVQEKVIPEVLLNKDLIVKSETGSGKSAAFAIPICEMIDWNENMPQALVLSPTRELAIQVGEDFKNIGRYKRIKSCAVFGKQPIREQINELKQKTHVVVGTPGRILDHMDRGSLKIEKIKYLVIDEADEMLNMGFIDDVEKIIKNLNRKIVKLLFSATISDEIRTLCEKHMKKPVDISINKKNTINANIEHSLYVAPYDKKLEALNDILICEDIKSTVIFGRTKDSVDKIYDYLDKKNYSVIKIHGGLMQKDRMLNMDKFKRGEYRILVATDVAARGIDVSGISHVINVDMPVEKESYVHRCGRSARAGAKGKAISIITNREDRYLKEIENYIGFKIEECELPSPETVSEKSQEGLKRLKSNPGIKEAKSKKINKSITKIYLNGGKKKKIRAFDIVGTISNIAGVNGDDIGIIDIQDNGSYVEILNGKGNKVLESLKNMTIKGKKLKVEKARR